jgi:hypothetical protein
VEGEAHKTHRKCISLLANKAHMLTKEHILINTIQKHQLDALFIFKKTV